MPKLTGSEASALAYLADYPNAENVDEVLSRLGPDARRVANAIIGRLTGMENENDKAAAEAIMRRATCEHKEYVPIGLSIRECKNCGHRERRGYED